MQIFSLSQSANFFVKQQHFWNAQDSEVLIYFWSILAPKRQIDLLQSKLLWTRVHLRLVHLIHISLWHNKSIFCHNILCCFAVADWHGSSPGKDSSLGDYNIDMGNYISNCPTTWSWKRAFKYRRQNIFRHSAKRLLSESVPSLAS